MTDTLTCVAAVSVCRVLSLFLSVFLFLFLSLSLSPFLFPRVGTQSLLR